MRAAPPISPANRRRCRCRAVQASASALGHLRPATISDSSGRTAPRLHRRDDPVVMARCAVLSNLEAWSPDTARRSLAQQTRSARPPSIRSPRHPQAPRASRSRAAGACSLAGLRASAIESESARRTINRCAGLERTRECRCCRRFRFGPGRIMRLPLWIRVEPPAPAVATFRDRPRPRPGSHPMDQLILTRSCPPKAPAGRPG
jgi:hypothetical protein